MLHLLNYRLTQYFSEVFKSKIQNSRFLVLHFSETQNSLYVVIQFMSTILVKNLFNNNMLMVIVYISLLRIL